MSTVRQEPPSERPASPHGENDQAKTALPQLYAQERLNMVRLAAFLVDDRTTAEDVVQDAFSGLVKAWPNLRDDGAVRAYLRTSVVNRSRTALSRRRRARSVLPLHEPPPPNVDESLILAEEHREVLQALAGLPRRQREVLILRYWSGLSEADMSQTLGVSNGTIKSTASRGLAALRAALGGTRHD